MKWFGESWGAPCCEAGQHVDTPTGEVCIECQRPIVDGDQGVILPYVSHRTPKGNIEVAYHIDCFLPLVVGPRANSK